MAEDTEKTLLLTSAKVIALAQTLTWLRTGLEEIRQAVQDNDPHRLVALIRVLLEHPQYLTDVVIMDEFMAVLCGLGNQTTAEHYASVRDYLRGQAYNFVHSAQVQVTA